MQKIGQVRHWLILHAFGLVMRTGEVCIFPGRARKQQENHFFSTFHSEGTTAAEFQLGKTVGRCQAQPCEEHTIQEHTIVKNQQKCGSWATSCLTVFFKLGNQVIAPFIQPCEERTIQVMEPYRNVWPRRSLTKLMQYKWFGTMVGFTSQALLTAGCVSGACLPFGEDSDKLG